MQWRQVQKLELFNPINEQKNDALLTKLAGMDVETTVNRFEVQFYSIIEPDRTYTLDQGSMSSTW